MRLSRSPALRELCVRYAAELERAGWSSRNHAADIGRSLAGGSSTTPPRRLAHAGGDDRESISSDLFGDRGNGDGASFIAWLEGPAPAGASHGMSRYVFYRVVSERPDVVRAYPDLDGRRRRRVRRVVSCVRTRGDGDARALPAGSRGRALIAAPAGGALERRRIVAERAGR